MLGVVEFVIDDWGSDIFSDYVLGGRGEGRGERGTVVRENGEREGLKSG